MTEMASTSEIDPIDAFVGNVRTEITIHQGYFKTKMRTYRWARVVVIVTAGVIPVLTPITGIDRLWLGILGGTAAATEAFIQKYRWRDAAITSMRTANAMEHLLNLYITSTAPYGTKQKDDSDHRFIVDIERIRAGAGDAFMGMWSEDRPPSATPA